MFDLRKPFKWTCGCYGDGEAVFPCKDHNQEWAASQKTPKENFEETDRLFERLYQEKLKNLKKGQ